MKTLAIVFAFLSVAVAMSAVAPSTPPATIQMAVGSVPSHVVGGPSLGTPAGPPEADVVIEAGGREHLVGGVWRLGNVTEDLRIAQSAAIPEGQVMLEAWALVIDAETAAVLSGLFRIAARDGDTGYWISETDLDAEGTVRRSPGLPTGSWEIRLYGSATDYHAGDLLITFVHATTPTDMGLAVLNLPAGSVRLDERRITAGWAETERTGFTVSASQFHAVSIRGHLEVTTGDCAYGKIGVVRPTGNYAYPNETVDITVPGQGVVDFTWDFGPEYLVLGAPPYDWRIDYQATGGGDFRPLPYVAFFEGRCPS